MMDVLQYIHGDRAVLWYVCQRLFPTVQEHWMKINPLRDAKIGEKSLTEWQTILKGLSDAELVDTIVW